MHTQSLIQAGLTKDQAVIYQTMIKLGEAPASKIALAGGLSRPLTYKILGELTQLTLAEKHDSPGKVARFAPAHPLKLKAIVDERLETAKVAQAAIQETINAFVSDFNLVSGKPGIQFFEGMAGIREVINDALTSQTDICSYVDIETVEREIPEISRAFGESRRKLGLKKRNLGIDTPANRKYLEGYSSDITEERLIPWPTESFGTVMQIYDNKVSYLTLGAHKIGVIIVDPKIYTMHRSLFEFSWNSPLAYKPPLTPQEEVSPSREGRSNAA